MRASDAQHLSRQRPDAVVFYVYCSSEVRVCAHTHSKCQDAARCLKVTSIGNWTCSEVLNLNTSEICIHKVSRVQAPCSLRDAVLRLIPCRALHRHSDWSKRACTV